MAYGNRKKGGTVGGSMGDAIILAGKTMIDIIGSGGTRGPNGSGTANVALAVQTPDGDYACASSKVYTEKSSIIQKISGGTSATVEGFVTISSFSKDLGALTVHNAKAIVIKNRSNVATELMIKLYDWRDDSDGTDLDVINTVNLNNEGGSGAATTSRILSMLLPANDFIYLPNSRILSYSPLAPATTESAANSGPGDVAIEPKDINSGNEYKKVSLFAGTTYASGNDVLVDGTISSATSTSLVVDDGDWFKVGDLLILGNTATEVVRVEAISSNTLTIERGLLGSTAGNITNNHEINYFFGNEHLPYNVGKCMTDQNGNFSQKGAFFGYSRTEDKKIDGLVAGSVAIGPFYTKGGYLDWGLQNIKPSDNTGLAVSTAYAITFVIDEYNAGGIDSTSTEQIVTFTTDASDVTFAGSGNAVIPKIQAALDAFFYDESSGLKNKKVSITLHNGDIRVSSLSNHSETRVGIAKASSGTTPFGVGRFPVLDGGKGADIPNLQGTPHGGGAADTIVYGPASSLELEEIDDRVSGKTIKNTSAFLIDDGLGNLRHNGNIVGIIDYVTGHIAFSYLPNAEFKVYAKTLSAHAGGVKHANNAYNSIASIEARSINTKQDGEIELILLG